MKDLVTILFMITAVVFTTACENSSNSELEKITDITLIDRTQSIEYMPSIDAYMQKIKTNIGFDENVYFGNEVTWYIASIDTNLVSLPVIIKLPAGAGEWNEGFETRQKLVKAKLSEVESEIKKVLAMPTQPRTSFYSSFSYYLSELSKHDGKKKISITTDTIDSYIHSKTNHLASKQQMRAMYPDFMEHFNAFYELDKINFDGIEIEFINSFSGKYQFQAYESQLFFSTWLDSLKANHTVIQNI